MLCLAHPAGRCRPSVLALALVAAFAPAYADTVVDASVSAGAGFVSGDRADRALFDQYNGLRPNDHLYGIFGAEYYRRNDETGLTVGFSASDLLTGNRELGLRYVKPGDWKFSIGYGELLRREPLVVNSGIVGVGTTLPQINPVAPGTGSDLDLHTKRSGLGFGFSKVITSRLHFDASASTEHKEGARLFGIGMACPSLVAVTCTGTNGVQVGSAVLFVPEPIDADHHQVEARLSYAAEKFRLALGYYGSFYRNDLGALTPVIPGSLFNPVGTLLPVSPQLRTILGQPVALAPDNQAHQVDLAGTWLYSPTTQVNFKLARTRATQNDNFAANGLTGAPAGVPDLGGRVTTTLAQVGFSARPIAKLTVLGNLRYEDRDDDTRIATYNVVDTFTFTNRQLPYRTERGKLQANYQFTPDWRGGLGVEHERIDRGTFTATSAIAGTTALRQKTDETTWRAEARRRLREDFSGAVVLEHSDRDGSHWLADNSGLGVTEVPDPTAAGTGFNRGIFMPTLADRKRDKIRFNADWQPTEQLSLQLNFDTGRDHYSAPSVYGVRSSALRQLTVDASYAFNDKWSVTGYASRGRQELDQGRPDAAFLAFRNTETNLGLGVSGKPTGKLEIGANYTYLQDRSTYAQTLDATADLASVNLLAATGGLPDITFRQNVLSVFGKYAFDKKSSLRAELAHYRTKWDDWAWGFNGTPFVYSDGTVATRKLVQNVTLLRVVYTYRWQ